MRLPFALFLLVLLAIPAWARDERPPEEARARMEHHLKEVNRLAQHFANADAASTAYVLAEAIKKIGTYDLILCGRQASDWDQAQVPSGVAEFLGLPSVTAAQKVGSHGEVVRVERLLEDGYEVLDIRPPCLVTVSNEANKPRYPTLKGIMAAGKKQLPVWNTAELGLDPARVGNAGALTKVTKLYIPRFEGKCEFIEAESPEEMGEKLALRLRELKII